MNYRETMEYIEGFTKSGKPVTDLSRIRRLLDLLGNPQRRLRCIHVAGTNGKGSTVEMLSNALRYAGYRVGSFTSPYMVHYEDRVRVDGEDIPQGRLCAIADVVRRSVQSDEYSQFEVSMAIAFLHFVAEECDVVVLETGIGGAVDSTNAIEDPLVSVITSISFDHTAILGDSLPKIAAQKAGIVKPNRPVVLSCDNSDPEVVEVVSEVAERQHSLLVHPNYPDAVAMDVHGETFTYLGESYSVRMLGRHQVCNAVTVVEVCRLLGSIGYDVPTDCVKRSLSTTQVTFRTQTFVRDGVTVVADGSHNVGGVSALRDTLRSCGVLEPVVLVGMVSTKDYATCCSVLDSFAKAVVCTDGYAYNAVDSSTLSERFTVESYTAPLESALGTALRLAKEASRPLVVCGSLYLLSRVLA